MTVEMDKLISKAVDEVLSQNVLRQMINKIEDSSQKNDISISQNELQFVADIAAIIINFAVKNAVIAAITSMSEISDLTFCKE